MTPRARRMSLASLTEDVFDPIDVLHEAWGVEFTEGSDLEWGSDWPHQTDIVDFGPDRAALMADTFAREHTHTEAEVRLMLRDGGAFLFPSPPNANGGPWVWRVPCRKGDRFVIPAGTPHGFDPSGGFAARRFLGPDGWQPVNQALDRTGACDPDDDGIQVELVDVEGTIGPTSFVRDVLFPLSAERMGDFLATAPKDDPEVVAWVTEIMKTLGGDPSDSEVVTTLRAWIEADVKATPLKGLQGRVWRKAYEGEGLLAPLAQDAAGAFLRWHQRGRRLAVYSSGSSEAVALYLRHSDQGDVSGLFDGIFGPYNVGPKDDLVSYRRIADRLGVEPWAIRFWSDSEAEVAAAKMAGLRVRLVFR